MNDDTLMPFGKHQGRKLKDIPADYFLWLWDNGVWADKAHLLHNYIRDNGSSLEQDAPDVIVKHSFR